MNLFLLRPLLYMFLKVYLLVTLVIRKDPFWAFCSLSNVNKLLSGL